MSPLVEDEGTTPMLRFHAAVQQKRGRYVHKKLNLLIRLISLCSKPALTGHTSFSGSTRLEAAVGEAALFLTSS